MLVGGTDNLVTLRKGGGTEIEVARQSLSKADQDYLNVFEKPITLSTRLQKQLPIP